MRMYGVQVLKDGVATTVSLHHTLDEAKQQASWESQFSEKKLARVIEVEAVMVEDPA